MEHQHRFVILFMLTLFTTIPGKLYAQDCTAIATGDAKNSSTWSCTGGISKPSEITDGTVTVPSSYTVTISNNQAWNADVIVDGGTMTFGGKLNFGVDDPGCDYSLVVKNGGVIEEGSGGGANERLIICGNTVITSQEPPPTGAQNWPADGFSNTGFDKNGENNSLLPVELISFQVIPNNGAADITWETASELNNDHFSIQKSENGINFVTIGTIDGKGTTNLPQQYTFTDSNPLTGISYYRLIQTDFDGTTKTFRPVLFSNEFATSQMAIIPNPVNENNTINITGISGQGRLSIVNTNGEEVYNMITDNVSNTISVSSAVFTPGIYLVSFSNSTIHQHTKFIVQ